MNIPERIWNKVSDADSNGCQNWLANKNEKGYGTVFFEGKPRRVHRLFYEALVGPIPPGMTLDHLCRNRGCVNPRHLQVVTNKENVLRGAGLTAMNARKTHCDRGHEYTPENTIKANGWRHCRTCRNMTRRAVYRRKAPGKKK